MEFFSVRFRMLIGLFSICRNIKQQTITIHDTPSPQQIAMPSSPPAIIEISDSEDEAPNIKVVQSAKNPPCNVAASTSSSRSNNHHHQQSTASNRVEHPAAMTDARKVRNRRGNL
jgi:hypothetical protein